MTNADVGFVNSYITNRKGLIYMYMQRNLLHLNRPPFVVDVSFFFLLF